MNRTYWLRTSECPLTDQDEDTLIVIGKKGTYFFNYKTKGWHFVDVKPKSPKLLNRPKCTMELVEPKELTNGMKSIRKLDLIKGLDEWMPVRFVDFVVNKTLSKPINVDPAQMAGGGYISNE